MLQLLFFSTIALMAPFVLMLLIWCSIFICNYKYSHVHLRGNVSYNQFKWNKTIINVSNITFFTVKAIITDEVEKTLKFSLAYVMPIIVNYVSEVWLIFLWCTPKGMTNKHNKKHCQGCRCKLVHLHVANS